MKRVTLLVVGLLAAFGLFLVFRSAQAPQPAVRPPQKSIKKDTKTKPERKGASRKSKPAFAPPKSKKISPKTRGAAAWTSEPVAQEEEADEEAERPDQLVYSTDREGIDAAMRAFMPKIRECYAQARIENPEIEGRIVASFTIDQNIDDPENSDIARIREVEILESELAHEDFENCIMDNLDMFWFAPPEDGSITIQYPFLFSY